MDVVGVVAQVPADPKAAGTGALAPPLIVSELSANAILHTASGQQSGSFHLALAVSSQVVALSVTVDGGTGTAPKAEHVDRDATHGRGLGMLSAIAHRVVIHDSQAGHTITAELFTSIRPGGHPC